MWRRYVPPFLRRTLATSDGPGGSLVVEERFGLRWLRHADGSVQGLVDAREPDRPQLPYVRVMLAGLAFADAHRVLAIGLGSGALPRALKRVVPQAQVEAVELDPEVVRLARAHLFLWKDIRVHVADARAFLEARSERWDLVLVDAYGGREIPPHLAGGDFLELVRAHLTPGGAALANVWSPAGNPGYGDAIGLWKKKFPCVRVLPVPGDANRIVVGTEVPPVDAALASRLGALPHADRLPSEAWDALSALSVR